MHRSAKMKNFPAQFTCLVLALALAIVSCGGETEKKAAAPAVRKPAAVAKKAVAPDLSNALVLSLASFAPYVKGKPPQTLPARLEFLSFKDGKWTMTKLEDDGSDVFHKAMHYKNAAGESQLLTISGTGARVKLWNPGQTALEAETLWEKDFGGKFSRMRDIEIADLYGDGQAAIAVATHDQGVVAILKPDGKGGFSIEELDVEENTFVHEIEIGDLNGDGILEVYATPSEPNRLDGREQTGAVVRYVPAIGEGRVVVADLGTHHAKEILVQDVDGDGIDELYVAVEGRIDPETKRLVAGVEIRRYDADTDPTQGVLVAEIPDRLSRFLTAADIDGDGKKEMVVSAFSSGLWLLRPSDSGLWERESIDKDSGGFEHAALLKDLDGDGRAELYVASDNDKEVRRYVWEGGRFKKTTIYRRKEAGSVFTWNLMAVPLGLVP